jgi:NAD(P)-dependent dehydrogenase (short-subunit alcohol dehydrogenase family)
MREQKSADRPAALVTGASYGIGAATALAFARNGYDVAVSATRVENLSAVMQDLAALGARVVPLALDLCSQSSIEHAMAEAARILGKVDVLVNNAGANLRKQAVDVTAAEWDTLIATNLTGTFFMTQQMGRHLIGSKRAGCIISIASTNGVVGVAERSTYGISKAAILHMTKMLAIEWAEHGIRVNAIAPGRVDTASPSRAASAADPKYMQAMLNRIPLRRLCTAEEVAAAACYLASPLAAYITGQILLLDGGLTSQ